MKAHENRIIRISAAVVWLVTGLLSLGSYPQQDSFALLARIGLAGTPAASAWYLGAATDIMLELSTVFKPCKLFWQTQATLVLIYTVVISIRLPEFRLHPFAPMLKNIPFLTLLYLIYYHEGITQ